MLAWSPILVQKIEIHALGFVLQKLQLNRHRPTEVAPHAHNYAQLVLYLSGEAIQMVNGVRRLSRTGDLFVIPRGVMHGFRPITGSGSRPLCLVLDYRVKHAGRQRVAHRRLAPSTLNELHRLLARVPPKGELTLAHYPTILAVVAQLLDDQPVTPSPTSSPGIFERVSGLLKTPIPLAKVAREVGYHPDHLNRKLKRDGGLGMRALRNRLRLETAQAALCHADTIAEVATQAGFDDPNYFSRWFRRQTMQTPRAWKAAQRRAINRPGSSPSRSSSTAA